MPTRPELQANTLLHCTNGLLPYSHSAPKLHESPTIGSKVGQGFPQRAIASGEPSPGRFSTAASNSNAPASKEASCAALRETVPPQLKSVATVREHVYPRKLNVVAATGNPRKQDRKAAPHLSSSGILCVCPTLDRGIAWKVGIRTTVSSPKLRAIGRPSEKLREIDGISRPRRGACRDARTILQGRKCLDSAILGRNVLRGFWPHSACRSWPSVSLCRAPQKCDSRHKRK
jgi:hypothetical protein